MTYLKYYFYDNILLSVWWCDEFIHVNIETKKVYKYNTCYVIIKCTRPVVCW